MLQILIIGFCSLYVATIWRPSVYNNIPCSIKDVWCWKAQCEQTLRVPLSRTRFNVCILGSKIYISHYNCVCSSWPKDTVGLSLRWLRRTLLWKKNVLQLSNKTWDAVLYGPWGCGSNKAVCWVTHRPWSTSIHCKERRQGSCCNSSIFSSTIFYKASSFAMTVLKWLRWCTAPSQSES